MVPLQEKQTFLLSSLEKERWPSEVKISKITHVLSPHAEEIQTFRHSSIYGKTRWNFRPGAKDLPGCTNCTHLTETTLKSLI